MLILTVPLISLRLQTYNISFKRFIFFFIHISILVRSIANLSPPNQLKSRVHIARFLLNIGSIWLFSMVINLNVCTYSHNLCLSLSKSQGAWVWSVQLDISFFAWLLYRQQLFNAFPRTPQKVFATIARISLSLSVLISLSFFLSVLGVLLKKYYINVYFKRV